MPADPYVARLLGPCILIPGTIRDTVVETEIGPLPWLKDASTIIEGDSVDVLIRPEDLEIRLCTESKAVVLSSGYQGEGSTYLLRLPSGGTIGSFVRGTDMIAEGRHVAIIKRKAMPFTVFRRTETGPRT